MCAPDWLAMREGADAAARAPELLEPLRAHLDGAALPGATTVVRDLGCGTGSMGRWLAGRLPGPQHWILHDRDAELLARAAVSLPDTAADGSPVTAETQQGDLTGLDAGALAGTSLVTASALLDILTADEVDGLAAACVEAGCPALLTLSVVGHVEFEPADRLDVEFATAFDAHQRRSDGGRRLLGPDAATAVAEAFRRRGVPVESRLSPWRLDASQAELAEEWLRGWIAAACEQWPGLVPHAEAYLRRRLEASAAGELRIIVGHVDLLALPTVGEAS